MNKDMISRRSVYEVAQQLAEQAAGLNTRPHRLAQKRIDQCKAARDRLGERFWRDVWMHALLIEQGMRDVAFIEEHDEEIQ